MEHKFWLLIPLFLLLPPTGVHAQKQIKEYLATPTGPVTQKKQAQCYRLLSNPNPQNPAGKSKIYFLKPKGRLAWEGHFQDTLDENHLLDTCIWYTRYKNQSVITRISVYDSSHQLIDQTCLSVWGDTLNYTDEEFEAGTQKYKKWKHQPVLDERFKGFYPQQEQKFLSKNLELIFMCPKGPECILAYTLWAEDKAKRKGPDSELALLYLIQGTYFSEVGKLEQSSVCFQQAIHCARQENHAGTQAYCMIMGSKNEIRRARFEHVQAQLKVADSLIQISGDTSLQLPHILMEGYLAVESGKALEGLQFFKKGLDFLLKLELGPLGGLKRIESYLMLAQASSMVGQLDSTHYYLDQIPGSPLMTGAMDIRALTLVNQGKIIDGIKLFREAWEFYDSMNLTIRKVQCEVNLAKAYFELGLTDSAYVWNKRASKSIVDLNSPVLELLLWNNFGGLYIDKGEFDSARICFRKMCAAAGQLGQPFLLGKANLAYSRLLLDEGRLDSAFSLLGETKQLFEKSPKRMEMTSLYSLLAGVYFNQGNLDEAVKVSVQFSQLAQDLGNPPIEIGAKHNLGRIYLKEGDIDNAWKYLTEAYQLSLQYDHEKWKALCLHSLGIAVTLKNETGRGIEYHKEAIQIQTELGRELEKAGTLITLSKIFIQQSQWDSAHFYLDKAHEIAQRIGIPRVKAEFLMESAEIQLGKGEYALADSTWRSALAFIQDQRLTLMEPLVLGKLGKLFLEKEEYDSARYYATRSLENNKGLFEAMPGERAGMWFTGRNDLAFDVAVESAWQQQDYASAFRKTELGKGRTFSRLLTMGTLPETELPPDLKRELDFLDNRFKILETHLLNKPFISGSIREKWSRERQELLEAKRVLKTQIAAANPEYANLVFPTPPSVGEIQTALKPEEAMISYYFGEQPFVFVITPKRIEMRPLGPKKLLTDLLQKFGTDFLDKEKASIVKTDIKKKGAARKAFPEISSALYAYLWKPVLETGLSGKSSMLISPDGPLYFFPFELLQPSPKRQSTEWEQYDYLIKSFQITYVPSASQFWNAREQAAPSLSDPDFLGVTLSDFQGNTCAASLGFSFQNFSEEPRWEKWQADVFPAGNSLLLSRSRSTEKALNSLDLSKFGCLHFHTHGKINTLFPPTSKILLNGDSLNDGCLELHEIFELDLNTTLVSLAVCETGLGKTHKREGLIGFARGLMYAGARQVVLSQWEVTETHSSRFFMNFYGRLGCSQDASIAEALRAVRLEMIREGGEAANPYHWSPFLQIGTE